jgi:mono/diheme cytochrome c family protein
MMKTQVDQKKNSGRILSALLVAVIIFVLAGCGEKQSSSTDDSPGSSKLENSKAPSSAQQVQVVHPQVTEETRKIYQYYCSQCHGNEGKGDGVNAKLLTVPPRNHTKADYLESRTDQQLFDAIKLGGLVVGRAPCMPAWGHTFDEKVIRSLVGYIRELCQCESAD